ncbi:hypothetical protein JHK84_027605 [Glycine max]|nr:hypothetical protein JHK84_027605 [Glycine max]
MIGCANNLSIAVAELSFGLIFHFRIIPSTKNNSCILEWVTMEKANTSLVRTKSDQLLELMVAGLKSPPSSDHSANGVVDSRKSSRWLTGASPGRGGKNTHIRKSRSAQISQMKLELDDVSSGAALSRASSASLGLSFSFTGFTMPPEEIADSKPFSDDDIPEDIEAGPRTKFQTEPTLPIYLKVMIGFVTQDDVLFPHLTVKETLTYAARLRLPKAYTKEQKEKRALDVIYELGLERCQDTMIGGSFVRGVSGGERKRVCIGNEIIINPSLLFLDEPTSGLDSTTALRIVQMLQDIAEAGKTVVTTIHQPSSRLFHKFDKLILLGKGSLLYFGKASEAMTYFQSIGCSPLISMNPAEFLLDLANGNINDVSLPSELEDKVQMGNAEAETQNGKPSPAVVHEYLVEAYETRVAETEKKRLMVPIPLDEALKTKVYSHKRQWGASWDEQFSILFWRGIKERRHDYFSWLRITQVLSTAVILGLLWWQSDTKNPKDLQDQAGLLFFIAVFWGFFPVFTAIFTFPQERAMLSKERAADMYRLSAYFLARTTSDLPLDLILPVLFLLVVYFMAGLRLSVAPFFLTVLTVFLCIVAAQGLGLAIGATLMDLKRATTLASVTVMTFMLAGGFFVQRVPIFFSWIRYMSFNYHTYKLLLKVQYEHISPVINGIRIDSGATEVAALIAMVFGYRFLAYLSLRRMKLQSGA